MEPRFLHDFIVNTTRHSVPSQYIQRDEFYLARLRIHIWNQSQIDYHWCFSGDTAWNVRGQRYAMGIHDKQCRG